MKTVLTCLMLLACSQVPPQPVGCLHYEPAVVELTGELVEVEEYGPPGYGEDPATDQRVKVPMLKLAKPVNVCGDPNSDTNQSSFSGLDRIQVVTDDQDYRDWIDRRVTVRGTLSEAMTGHHYTNVLLTIKEVQGG